MISVIIPAHDEEAVIDRCLTALLDGAPPSALEVFVVCNGCTDRTAELARDHGDPVHVLEIPQASKVLALNAGDAAARGFPRCYIDADVVANWEAVKAVAAVLDKGEVLAAAPRVQFDLQRCGWFVRSYYQVWQTIPYFKEGMIGAGFYALSEAGRAKFTTFPEITADDGFVRSLFGPGERDIVEHVRFTVFPPKTIAGVSRIKTRSRYGTLEQRASLPGRGDRSSASWLGTAKALCLIPSMWPRIPVYLAIVCVTRFRARWRMARGSHRSWDRDDSSRGLSS